MPKKLLPAINIQTEWFCNSEFIIKKDILKSLIAWIIVLVLLILAFVFYRDTVNQVLEGVKNFDLLTVFYCCLSAVLYYICEAVIYFRMGRQINPSYRWYSGLSTSYKCEFVRILTMGTGAGVAEIVFLQKDGIPAGKGAGLTLMQYGLKRTGMMFMGLIAFILLCIKPVSAAVMAEYKLLILGALTFSVVVSVAVTGLTFSKKFNQLMNIILDKAEKRFLKHKNLFEKWRLSVNQLQEAGSLYIHHPVLILELMILNVLKMLAFYVIPGFILMECSGLVTGTLLMAVAFVSATILPAPSGVGALEFAFVSFFSAYIQQAEAITTVLVYRFATWIVPCVIGMVFFTVDGLKSKRGKKCTK